MGKSVWLIGAALLATAALSSNALGAVNVKKLPTATFSGATVTVTGGEFSGLGNTEAFAELTVTGSATYTCRNPQGHPSPGQNPVEAQSGSSGPVGLENASSHSSSRRSLAEDLGTVSAEDDLEVPGFRGSGESLTV